ncbi:MAG: InlB B-repeat-containing protein [Candidatus Pelethousia sp.]|nr:InlB B-repeat-containing protein [Candidatus Pelethousia sp.]
MLRMGKRPLSLLCACILVFSLLPAVALAADPPYTVSFSINDGVGTPAAINVATATTISAPSLSVVSRAYYVFNGWYKDSDLKQKWNFSTDKVTESMTLYGAWEFTPAKPSSSGSTTGGYSYNNYSPSACYSAYYPSVYYPADYYYYPSAYYTAPGGINIPKTGDAVNALPYLCLSLSALCAAAFALRRSKAAWHI